MNNEIKEVIDYISDRIIPNEKWNKVKECITQLQQCYCNRTDCIGRIKNSKKYDSLQQRIDIAISKIDNIFSDEDWYINYEYNDLEDVLKEVKEILQGSDKE